jgi:hypothetical protein
MIFALQKKIGVTKKDKCGHLFLRKKMLRIRRDLKRRKEKIMVIEPVPKLVILEPALAVFISCGTDKAGLLKTEVLEQP